MRTRNTFILTAAIGLTSGGIGTAVALAIGNDPVPVASVDLSDLAIRDVSVSSPEQTTVPAGRIENTGELTARPLADTVPAESAAVTVPASPSAAMVVPGLERRQGTLAYRGDEFWLDDRELDAGPDRWLVATTAPGDVDGDGAVGSWWQELNGLIGRSIEVLGEVDDDDIDAFEINGVALRPLYTEITPWSEDGNDSAVRDDLTRVIASGLSAAEAVQRALEQIPGAAIDVEIDFDDGQPYWEVEVRSVDGAIYDVEMDAITGIIIDIDRS